MRFFVFTILFLLTFKGFCQEPPLVSDKIDDKVVIGFPGITISQLNQIQAKFLTYNQISSAKFVSGGDHDCMLITFNQSGTDFSVYGEMLKSINPFYDVENCYFKPKEAYAEILTNIGNATIIDLK